jgi:hypothetical protein
MDRVLALQSGVLGLQSLPNASQVGPIPTLTHPWDTHFYVSGVTKPFLFQALVTQSPVGCSIFWTESQSMLDVN